MHPKFRPILGVSLDDLDEVRYPVLASPKFDGIRCLTMDLVPDHDAHTCVPICRSLKRVPNHHVYLQMARNLPPGLDGELMMYGTDGKPLRFYEIQSGIMSQEGNPQFCYHVFDFFIPSVELWKKSLPYDQRLQLFARWYRTDDHYIRPEWLKPVDVQLIRDRAELDAFESKCVEEGYEGICFRRPDSPYKYGRSTKREQCLIKVKRFETAEALVVGVVEERHNSNPAERNELGYQERSSHKQGMVGKGRLGALVCRPLTVKGDQSDFQVGSGFTATQRENMWVNQGETVIGKIVQYKHQQHGQKDRPRTPIFLGFRDPRDLEVTQSLEQQPKLL